MKILIIILIFIAVAIGLFIYFRPDEITFIPTPSSGSGAMAEKSNLIRVFTPRIDAVVRSPLTIKGEARGNWFFEATFPVVLTDWDGRIIIQHYAQAQGEWMTTDFVPFEAMLEFESSVFPGADENHFSRRGYLILKKDNPSGLPEYDDALEIPILFE